MSRQLAYGPKTTAQGHAVMKWLEENVDHADFTDGGAAVGTIALTAKLPKDAVVSHAVVKVQEGFAGDTSAAMTIGDGTDVDRFNTSTINVFADAEDGIAAGPPSGARHCTAEVTITLTITTAADWGSVSAGKLSVRIYYV